MTVHWSLALAFFSMAQLAVECWWMRPFSVHHAHQNSFDLGEASRLLGAFGAWWISSGLLLLDAVVGGELLLLRVASRSSLSPPGVLLWAFGMGLRIF